MPDTEQDQDENTRMPLWQHLSQLRTALFRSLIAVSLALVITYNYCDPIVAFLEAPLLNLLPPGEGLYYTGIGDKFFIYLKVAILAAVALVSPYLLWELWNFVSPGLYQKEKRFFLPFILFSTVSFVAGLAFAYYLVIPYGYKFLIEFGSSRDKAIITLTEYFSLTLKMLLALGLVFEVPVVIIILAKIGIVDEKFLVKHRKTAFVVSSVVAAVATPSPDAFTMLLVMFPLYILYEISIIGVKLVARG